MNVNVLKRLYLLIAIVAYTLTSVCHLLEWQSGYIFFSMIASLMTFPISWVGGLVLVVVISLLLSPLQGVEFMQSSTISFLIGLLSSAVIVALGYFQWFVLLPKVWRLFSGSSEKK